MYSNIVYFVFFLPIFLSSHVASLFLSIMTNTSLRILPKILSLLVGVGVKA